MAWYIGMNVLEGHSGFVFPATTVVVVVLVVAVISAYSFTVIF
jgi:hypothetical protein